MNENQRREQKEKIKEYFDFLEEYYYDQEYNDLDNIDSLESIKNKLLKIEQEKSSFNELLSLCNAQLNIPLSFSFNELISNLWLSVILDLKSVCKLIFSNLGLNYEKHKNINLFILVVFCIFILSFRGIISSILIVVAILYIALKIPNVIKTKRRLYIQEVTNKKQEYQGKIYELEQEYEKANFELIKIRKLKENISYIKELENQILEWIEQDEQYLINKARNELQIKDPENPEPGQYKAQEEFFKPIVSFCGIRSPSHENFIITTNRELEPVIEKNKELCIDTNDFYSLKGLDNKFKYGVYEFVAIFLFENFLSYYRCYWNFLKRDAVDIETCEYLYDSIVSIKTQEKSSLRLKNSDHRRKYRDLLSITTMDGNILYCKMDDDRTQNIYSRNQKSKNYISDLNLAAASIRYWLRRRKIKTNGIHK
ncbi:hypothetical protein [Oscillatoria sp. HE19RPO]|uniref:hypothetical protein n=1 Tax=Oscillatoria sp. HE19RPO TaxID=2954806 RepID=UPI0020C2ECF0|nr:hypothetical protein [Oscillatoria sp. HE19RPO]